MSRAPQSGLMPQGQSLGCVQGPSARPERSRVQKSSVPAPQQGPPAELPSSLPQGLPSAHAHSESPSFFFPVPRNQDSTFSKSFCKTVLILKERKLLK